MDQELKDALDRRELEERVALQVQYGHSPGTAALLARYSRDMQAESLERPLSPVIVTGI